MNSHGCNCSDCPFEHMRLTQKEKFQREILTQLKDQSIKEDFKTAEQVLHCLDVIYNSMSPS